MGAEESSIKKRIWIVGTEYSVLKEDIKVDECGWSYAGAHLTPYHNNFSLQLPPDGSNTSP
jgi:hypothetical protein